MSLARAPGQQVALETWMSRVQHTLCLHGPSGFNPSATPRPWFQDTA